MTGTFNSDYDPEPYLADLFHEAGTKKSAEDEDFSDTSDATSETEGHEETEDAYPCAALIKNVRTMLVLRSSGPCSMPWPR
jgi:hypothetical protein